MIRLMFILIIIISWLQYSLWFSKNGIYDFIRINKEVKSQQAYNARLKARNKLLFAEIDDLNSGYEAVEERARKELVMIKHNETFYRLIPQKNYAVAPTYQRRKE